jgi:hypothetical protein
MMGEEGIKSALEIAMEKISRLPELTPEEIAGQKEREYMPIGEALCQRYLNGAITDKDLSFELEKCHGDKEHIVRRALISSLCRSIQLENLPNANMALKGIMFLFAGQNKAVERLTGDFQRILEEFVRDRDGKYGEFQAQARDRLNKLGISGSAIRINPNEDKFWQAELRRIRHTYEPRLSNLRKILIQEFQTE